MGLLDFLGSAIKPITEMVQGLVTTDSERMQLTNELTRVQNEIASKLIEQENKLIEAQSNIIQAEAKGESWLQRNWRPLMMLWFAILLGLYYFGLTPQNLTQNTINNLHDLLKIGIGGYVVGRSGEKIAKEYFKAKSN
jgi:hypothetical protein